MVKKETTVREEIFFLNITILSEPALESVLFFISYFYFDCELKTMAGLGIRAKYWFPPVYN